MPLGAGCQWQLVTEDLVWMLEAMGLRTGIDIEQLLAVRERVKQSLPDEPLYGFIPDAGLPKGFKATR